MAAAKRKGRGVLFELKRALEDDFDLLSAEDFESMSEEDAERVIAALDFGPAPSAEEISGKAEKALNMERATGQSVHEVNTDGERASSGRVWTIARPDLVARVWAAIDAAPLTVLAGAIGSGKSTLWRRHLRSDAGFSRRFDAAVTLDCFGLSGRSKRTIEQDALYAQFTDRDEDYVRFLTRVRDVERPFLAFVLEKFATRRGLVVIDHVEALSASPEVTNWLAEFLTTMRERGVKVLVLAGRDEVMEKAPFKHAVETFGAGGAADICKVGVPPIDAEEIAVWWAQPRFAAHVEAGLDADSIWRTIGGSPRVLRDFGRFIEAEELEGHCGRPVLERFLARMRDEFSPETARLVTMVSGHFPRHLDDPCAAKPGFPRRAVLETGAVTETADGALTFVSPLFAHRYQVLRDKSALAGLYLSGPDILFFRRIRAHQETLADRLCHSWMQDDQPISVWSRLTRCMRNLGLVDLELHARDAANSKIWCLLQADDPARHVDYNKPSPLYSDEDPDFVQAVQIGRVVRRSAGRVYLPLIGGSGRVTIVLIGKVRGAGNAFETRLLLRRIWNLVLALRPAIALAVERTTNRRLEQKMRDALYRVQARTTAIAADTVFQAGCAAALVLDRDGAGGAWKLASVSTPEGAASEELKADMAVLNPMVFDAIEAHPSGRGLVLRDDQLRLALPRVRRHDFTIGFVWPVSVNEGACRMVAFLFKDDGDAVLSGQEQRRLTLIASTHASQVA